MVAQQPPLETVGGSHCSLVKRAVSVTPVPHDWQHRLAALIVPSKSQIGTLLTTHAPAPFVTPTNVAEVPQPSIDPPTLPSVPAGTQRQGVPAAAPPHGSVLTKAKNASKIILRRSEFLLRKDDPRTRTCAFVFHTFNSSFFFLAGGIVGPARWSLGGLDRCTSGGGFF